MLFLVRPETKGTRLSAVCGSTQGMAHFFTALPAVLAIRRNTRSLCGLSGLHFWRPLLDVSFLGAGDGTTYGISGTGAFGASLNGHVFMRNGGANLGYWDIEFRDPSAWYHFVLAIDTDQSTAANRNRLYVNGVDQGAPSANFGSGASTSINAASIHSIGTFNLPSSLSPFAG